MFTLITTPPQGFAKPTGECPFLSNAKYTVVFPQLSGLNNRLVTTSCMTQLEEIEFLHTPILLQKLKLLDVPCLE